MQDKDKNKTNEISTDPYATVLTKDDVLEISKKIREDNLLGCNLIIESIQDSGKGAKMALLGRRLQTIYEKETNTLIVRGYKLTINDGKDLFRHIDVRSIKFIGVDTSNCQSMQCMFARCDMLEELDVSCFITDKVKTMEGMFHSCETIEKLDLSNFSIPKVKDLSLMFGNCYGLVSLDISGFYTNKVKKMRAFIADCANLKTLKIGCLDIGKATDVRGIYDVICAPISIYK